MKMSNLTTRSRRVASLALCAVALAGCADVADLTAPSLAPRHSHGVSGTGYVVIILQTDPDGDPTTFSFTHNFADHSDPAVPSPFTLTDEWNVRIISNVAAGTYTVTELVPADWELVAVSADLTETTGCEGSSSIDLATGIATIEVSDGGFVACTFVNRRRTSGGEDPPPGDDPPLPPINPRTVGQWRNAAQCSNGSQYEKNEARLTLDFYLPGHTAIFPLGDIESLNCEQASNILAKRDLSGGVKGGDAAYALAAQLLGARLNKAAGAPFPGCVADAVESAHNLLDQIGFTGRGDYLAAKPRNPSRGTAQGLTQLLARYNAEDTAVMSNDCS